MKKNVVHYKKMWFPKQGPALAYHDSKPGHVIIAQDISGHGHKKYGVVPRDQIDRYVGPYNELIRTHSVCRLYFDLDAGPMASATANVDTLLTEVCHKLYEVYKLHVDPGPRGVIVLCSSSESKFSKHVIFRDVHFKNNWEHMKNFVGLLSGRFDTSVYSRNRCFRMAGCHKFGDTRVFRPGLPSSALVCVPQSQLNRPPLEFTKAPLRGPRRLAHSTGSAAGTFNVKRLNVPDGWTSTLTGLEPGDLLRAIHPNQSYQAFFSIGCAYKRAGGSANTFCDWCRDWRQRAGVMRQWRGWNRNDKGYGYTFLKELALSQGACGEADVHLNEAFGFHVDDFNVTHINSTYLSYADIGACTEGCLLIKSRTGSGKSTIARALATSFSGFRILYLVSSRPLAYGARDSLNAAPDLHFISYLETDRPLHKIDHLVCSIQSLWRGFRLDPQAYDLIICDELSSIIEDMCNVTNKHPRENQAAFRKK